MRINFECKKFTLHFQGELFAVFLDFATVISGTCHFWLEAVMGWFRKNLNWHWSWHPHIVVHDSKNMPYAWAGFKLFTCGGVAWLCSGCSGTGLNFSE